MHNYSILRRAQAETEGYIMLAETGNPLCRIIGWVCVLWGQVFTWTLQDMSILCKDYTHHSLLSSLPSYSLTNPIVLHCQLCDTARSHDFFFTNIQAIVIIEVMETWFRLTMLIKNKLHWFAKAVEPCPHLTSYATFHA